MWGRGQDGAISRFFGLSETKRLFFAEKRLVKSAEFGLKNRTF